MLSTVPVSVIENLILRNFRGGNSKQVEALNLSLFWTSVNLALGCDHMFHPNEQYSSLVM